MSVASRFPVRALGAAAFGIMMLTAAAVADPSAYSRLMFDPGALDRSPLGPDRDPARPAADGQAKEGAAATGARVWTPDTFNLPNFGDGLSVSRGLREGFSSAKNRSSAADATLFEPRVNFGTLSIGLETDTVIKQRSLAGDGDKDPQRDTILDDPKRQRGFLPFIGLSAKSTLQ